MSSGFIQFGDGPRIPVTGLKTTFTKDETAPAQRRIELVSFEVDIPLPPENAAAICRAVGAPEAADRIEIAAHPDLAELNAQMDGFYDA